jgi:hypothetical protein
MGDCEIGTIFPAEEPDPVRFGIGRLAGIAGLPAALGIPIVDTDRTCSVGYELKQTASHHQIFDEVKDLVRIVEMCVEENCRGQTK